MVQRDFQKEKEKLQLLADKKEHEQLEELWMEACQKEKICNGKLLIAWKKLTEIPHQIYTFSQLLGRDLVFLNLDCNNLTNIGRIPSCCRKLRHLSLALNHITEIPEDIALLTCLQHLNLVRNIIKTLPTEIGDLTSLEVFECANNCLTDLPASVSNLTKLQRLNLECNNLHHLFDEIIFMRISVLNCNCNALTALPRNLHLLGSLEVLSACRNQLTEIPEYLGDSKSLQVLHLSNNFITELPNSFRRLKTLQSLWLDFNKISRLPNMLHDLESLTDLRMEGNVCKALTVATIVRPMSLAEKSAIAEKMAMERVSREIELETIALVVDQAKQNAQCFLDSDLGSSIIFKAATELWKAIRLRKPISSLNVLMCDETAAKYMQCVAPTFISALTQLFTTSQENIRVLTTIVEEREKRERSALVFRRNNDRMVGYVADELKCNFVVLVGEMKRNHVMEVNNKIRIVLRSWVGPTLMDIFWAWKIISKERKNRINWEKLQDLQSSRLKYEQDCAFLLYAMDRVGHSFFSWLLAFAHKVFTQTFFYILLVSSCSR